MTDVIQLRGVRAMGVHGVLAEEQVRAQPFEVDVDLHVDLHTAGKSDRLEDTADYGVFADVVVGCITNERYALLERLAERIAELALADTRVASVTVTVRKLRPPLAVAVDHVRGLHHSTVTRAFLGLGSNMGDRRAYLRDAIADLPDVVAVSPVYETDPVGGPRDQDSYLNLVVELDTERPARELLGIAHRLETAAGRVRGERWGPRTLDIDVLIVGDAELDESDLVVPHPRLRERSFVLIPLHDLAPDLVPERPVDRSVRAAGEL